MNPKRRLFILLTTVCLLHTAAQEPFRMDTLQYNGRNAIDFVLMGDGYTADAAQQSKFSHDARNYTDSLFSLSPFSHYRRYFNVYALHVVSPESGITHPGIIRGDTLWCRSVSEMDTLRCNTFFGVTLDCAGIHRLTHIMREYRVDSLLQIYCPEAIQAGIIANSGEYGGSGGRVCVATCERRSHRIFIHELAHSFADLADEYFAGDFYFGEYPNQSATSSPDSVRWHRWIGEDGVGVFPYSGSEMAKNYYKPYQAYDGSKYCMMELLKRDFCPVCREAIIKAVHRSCNPVGGCVPQDTLLPRSRTDRTFELTGLLRPEPNTLEIVWKVDGEEVARDVERLTVTKQQLKKGRPHTVEAIVTDVTPMVRDEAHTAAFTRRIVWQIKKKKR